MSIPINLDQEVALYDATGKVVGYLAPASVIKEMQAELDRLRKELDKACLDRDNYRAGLISLMEEYVTFTPQELAEAEQSGLTFQRLRLPGAERGVDLLPAQHALRIDVQDPRKQRRPLQKVPLSRIVLAEQRRRIRSGHGGSRVQCLRVPELERTD